MNDTHSVKLRCVSPDMRDGLVWQSAPDGSVRQSGGPKAQHFRAGKNYPNAREYGVWRFSKHCTRVSNFSRRQRLYRHNTVPGRATKPDALRASFTADGG